MENYQYQYNLSDSYKTLYNHSERIQKAEKIIAILKDYFNDVLKDLRLIDIGSSTGIITNHLSKHFCDTVGIDIDENAVKYAKENFENTRLHFFIQDSMDIKFPDNTFDVVNCTHIYEHVPDSHQLMREIFRILKPGGICFFSAGNRFVLIEGHYKLPLLSVMPKWMAHIYLRLMGRGKYYYENHLSLWGLKKLVSKFELIDYTRLAIQFPERFHLVEMVSSGGFKQKLGLFVLKFAYWLSPNYLWVLKK